MSCENSNCPNSITFPYTCNLCKIPYYCTANCSYEDWQRSHRHLCPASVSIQFKDFCLYQEDQGSSLGEGTYGKVTLFQHRKSEKLFAVKEIPRKYVNSTEIEVHKHLKHPYIISLYYAFEEKDSVHMVLEYAINGSLFYPIRRSKGLSEEESWHYFMQTCMGLKYLHSKNIIHRDIKPENLLLDKNKNIKICDFGWSVQSDDLRTTSCGTVDYMAPEIIERKGYGVAVDLWALGVLLYELVHGYAPFTGGFAIAKFEKILENKIVFKEGLSSEIMDLILSLIRSDPQTRLTIDQIFEHPWASLFARNYGIRIGQKVQHPDYKSGTIIDIRGLLCELHFRDHILTVPAPELHREVTLLPMKKQLVGGHTPSIAKSESILLGEFEEYCAGALRQKRRVTKAATDKQLFQDEDLIPTNESYLPSGFNSGQFATQELVEIEKFRKTRPPLNSMESSSASKRVVPHDDHPDTSISLLIERKLELERLSAEFNSEHVTLTAKKRITEKALRSERAGKSVPWYRKWFGCSDSS